MKIREIILQEADNTGKDRAKISVGVETALLPIMHILKDELKIKTIHKMDIRSNNEIISGTKNLSHFIIENIEYVKGYGVKINFLKDFNIWANSINEIMKFDVMYEIIDDKNIHRKIAIEAKSYEKIKKISLLEIARFENKKSMRNFIFNQLKRLLSKSELITDPITKEEDFKYEEYQKFCEVYNSLLKNVFNDANFLKILKKKIIMPDYIIIGKDPFYLYKVNNINVNITYGLPSRIMAKSQKKRNVDDKEGLRNITIFFEKDKNNSFPYLTLSKELSLQGILNKINEIFKTSYQNFNEIDYNKLRKIVNEKIKNDKQLLLPEPIDDSIKYLILKNAFLNENENEDPFDKLKKFIEEYIQENKLKDIEIEGPIIIAKVILIDETTLIKTNAKDSIAAEGITKK